MCAFSSLGAGAAAGCRSRVLLQHVSGPVQVEFRVLTPLSRVPLRIAAAGCCPTDSSFGYLGSMLAYIMLLNKHFFKKVSNNCAYQILHQMPLFTTFCALDSQQPSKLRFLAR